MADLRENSERLLTETFSVGEQVIGRLFLELYLIFSKLGNVLQRVFRTDSLSRITVASAQFIKSKKK